MSPKSRKLTPQARSEYVMELGANQETAVQGGTLLTALFALVKTFYNDWRRTQRNEKLEAKFKEINDRLVGHDEELEAHALYDANTYVPRPEFTNVMNRLDTKLDNKFDILNSNIITAIRDGAAKSD